MPDKFWKKHERDIARKFGGKRVALSGSGSGGTSADVRDSRRPDLYIEQKSRKSFSVLNYLRTATLSAIKEGGKTAIVTLKEKGRPGFYLLCKLDPQILQAVLEGLGVFVVGTEITDEQKLPSVKARAATLEKIADAARRIRFTTVPATGCTTVEEPLQAVRDLLAALAMLDAVDDDGLGDTQDSEQKKEEEEQP